MERPRDLSGQLLVAGPQLLDPNFRRTVVLLLDHGDDGALGVVLDRPTPVDLGRLLPGWEDVVSPPGGVFQGGPVGLDGAVGVATALPGVPWPSSVSRLTGPFGVVDLDADPTSVVGRVAGLRIFAGHAGWAKGQLEAEIDAGGWYVLPALPLDATTPTPERLWRQVLRRQGGELAIVSTFSEDPSLN